MNSIEYIIIADTNDFTSDYVAIELNKRNKKYLRINRDKFSEDKIEWNIVKNKLKIEIDKDIYYIDNNLKGVYYRAPVYLHYNYNSTYEEQLYKTQWMAFIKNLICFENAIWLNNPVDTYKAENKMLQLKYASQLGMLIPKTYVINASTNKIKDDEKYAIKSIDTVYLRNREEEAFLYTNIMEGNEINNSQLNISPVVVQEFMEPKIDLRITVVGNRVYHVKIVKSTGGVYGDWRKEKDNVDFINVDIPESLEKQCINLVEKLNLKYGAIDMVLYKDNYYFIEINPTGEWAWLVESSDLHIYKDIVDIITGEEGIYV